MNKTLKDFLDRVLSTGVQAFVGTMTAAQLTGLGDLKSAVFAAGTAAAVAVVKVLGVNASKAAAELEQTTPADVDSVLKTIAAKLRAK